MVVTCADNHLSPIHIDFIVEHSEVQPLDNRVVKKFISLAKNPIPTAHIYEPTIFRWDFGDGRTKNYISHI